MSKYKNSIYALTSGVLLSLAWTQWMNGLILMLAYVPLLFVEDNLYRQRHINKSVVAFYYSFISFIIWNLATTWWLAEISKPGMLVIVILNSICMASVFWAFHFSKRLLGIKTGYFLFVFFWIAFEYLHLNWELSWSWLNLGNGLGKNIEIIQWYKFTGTLGGSLWILTANIIILFGLIKIIKFKTFRAGIYNFIVVFLLILIPISISFFIFYSDEDKGNPCNIVIIQPNIDPFTEKFDGLNEQEQINLLINLAKQKADISTDYFIAPETALFKSIWEDKLNINQGVRQIIAFLQNYPDAKFIIGAVTKKKYQIAENRSPVARKLEGANIYYDEYNSALQITAGGKIEIYHKSNLVIGVEKMPFPKTLGFLEKLTIDLGGTNASLDTDDEPVVFSDKAGNCNIATLICYESVFGEYLNKSVRKGANAVAIITNDGWWGETPGYIQHLRYSQIRAIETGRGIARSANTGISCFINQKGELLQASKFGNEDVIKGTISPNSKFTFYTTNGDYIGRIASFLAVLGILFTIVGALKKQN
ncbi:MAG: apolipoprotein N-acyltransferase [Bacteroidota bacterium]|nr:apolipoprotein N-acyltransferase [Bacteroidota bacterium]